MTKTVYKIYFDFVSIDGDYSPKFAYCDSYAFISDITHSRVNMIYADNNFNIILNSGDMVSGKWTYAIPIKNIVFIKKI